jgi:SAM-dependent methyltransferase
LRERGWAIIVAAMQTDQAAGQSWSATGYRHHAGFVAELGRPVVDLLAPVSGERILDLGCGDGALTAELAALGIDVVGSDASPELLAAAAAKGLETVLADGHDLPFEAEFDAVFSNAALHWMTRPDEVIRGVVRALRPGGRFVAEFGGLGNVAAITTALRAALLEIGVDGLAIRPWFFPSPCEYHRRLEAQGFSVESMNLIPRPTPLPTGMAGWLETFGSPFLQHAPADRRPELVERVVALLEPALSDADGNWTADYVRLRFRAVLPAG